MKAHSILTNVNVPNAVVDRTAKCFHSPLSRQLFGSQNGAQAHCGQACCDHNLPITDHHRLWWTGCKTASSALVVSGFLSSPLSVSLAGSSPLAVSKPPSSRLSVRQRPPRARCALSLAASSALAVSGFLSSPLSVSLAGSSPLAISELPQFSVACPSASERPLVNRRANSPYLHQCYI